MEASNEIIFVASFMGAMIGALLMVFLYYLIFKPENPLHVPSKPMKGYTRMKVRKGMVCPIDEAWAAYIDVQGYVDSKGHERPNDWWGSLITVVGTSREDATAVRDLVLRLIS